ncbi:WhiB family transcriptional regulator [Nonomuraea indica]|uniref:WhiB family transcriptional regulator n=1 Tax=Nonomuraea indica TaxID=1581193 RepID=UPI000C7ACB5D|nr:WhiB family transcriptional regulator [Nonomuraea indica]
MATPDWGWTDWAACRGQDLVLFFGPAGEKQNEKRHREARAVAICDRCPVKLKCRQTAFVLKQDEGVWGGLGEEERKTKRRTWVKAMARQRVRAAV